MTTGVAIEDPVLAESLRCLAAHVHPEWGDRDPFDAFCRLVAKTRRPAGWTSNTHLVLSPAQVASRHGMLTTQQLGKLVRPHGRTAGNDFDCPIILVEYGGATFVLDGNTRINRWVAASDQHQHRVHIHTVTSDGKHIEHPGQ